MAKKFEQINKFETLRNIKNKYCAHKMFNLHFVPTVLENPFASLAYFKTDMI